MSDDLKRTGVIAGYTAIIDPAAFGITLDVFIEVSLDLQQAKAFEEAIQEQEEVVECYAVTGGRDYLLHVMVTDIDASDHFLRNQLIHLPGVEHLKTHLALNPIKKSQGHTAAKVKSVDQRPCGSNTQCRRIRKLNTIAAREAGASAIAG
ncbi:MAG: Lrp/AsnC family transcriptional regulator [Pseudomonadales bacterium]|nr:Lrp/AsnC family transcriptional regulator [Pseudomonadales bacterium]MDP6470671.1 Lrp/AsnC family transcriptional regulator [Pseudomonadales bacterium]MDP6828472.1 Lrp/AsnC family transcriptional regulator [Pseudomonadales bacterium]